MSDAPREFDDDAQVYARPNQKWVCGWSAEGKACPLGPTVRGACRADSECVPYKNGDTWICARTLARGGKCQAGPLPDGACCLTIPSCQPTRSLLAKRSLFTFSIFSLAIGFALIVVAASQKKAWISPGPLVASHGTFADDCAKCHRLGDATVTQWASGAIAGKTDPSQSQQCMECHDMGKNGLFAHGLDPKQLTERTSKAKAALSGNFLVSTAKSLFGPPAEPDENLQCATCHREHQGAGADLLHLTNDQCQSCHQNAFASFEKGHPDFEILPMKQRSFLYFDHATHYGRHFQERNDVHSIGCQQCHVLDSNSSHMKLRGFEQTCASCHDQQITQTLDPGLVVLAVPGLDLQTLKANNLDVGVWPPVHPLHVEAQGASSFIRLLLQSSDRYAEIALNLDSIDLRDLRSANPQQLQAVEEYIWLFKETLYEILQGGHPYLRQKLQSVLGKTVTEFQVAELVKQIPLAGIGEMRTRWFPSLDQEVRRRLDGVSENGGDADVRENPPKPNAKEIENILSAERTHQRVNQSGWYVRDSDMSLRYRPTGHADPMLKALLEVALCYRQEEPSGISHAGGLLYEFASVHSTGRCMKCHAAEADSAGVFIHWNGYRASPDARPLTKFSHGPHLTLLQNSACQQCHQIAIDPETNPKTEVVRPLYRSEFITPAGFPNLRPQGAASDFSPISKVNCTQCHRQGLTNSRCLTCHHYHVVSGNFFDGSGSRKPAKSSVFGDENGSTWSEDK